VHALYPHSGLDGREREGWLKREEVRGRASSISLRMYLSEKGGGKRERGEWRSPADPEARFRPPLLERGERHGAAMVVVTQLGSFCFFLLHRLERRKGGKEKEEYEPDSLGKSRRLFLFIFFIVYIPGKGEKREKEEGRKKKPRTGRVPTRLRYRALPGGPISPTA